MNIAVSPADLDQRRVVTQSLVNMHYGSHNNWKNRKQQFNNYNQLKFINLLLLLLLLSLQSSSSSPISINNDGNHNML